MVVAESLEVARDAAAQLRIEYAAQPHDVVLRADHPGFYKPDSVNGGYATDSVIGDAEAALATAAVTRRRDLHDARATTTTRWSRTRALADWDGGTLTVHDSNQGSCAGARDAGQAVRARAGATCTSPPQHVGGGFGSKGTPRPSVVLAALAASPSSAR